MITTQAKCSALKCVRIAPPKTPNVLQWSQINSYPRKTRSLVTQRTKMSWRLFSLLTLSLTASLLGVSCSKTGPPDKSSDKNVQMAEVAQPFSGEMWMKWDRPTRLAFVMGNLRGYWDGQDAGCGEAKILAQSLPGVKGITKEVAEDLRFRCASKWKPSIRTFESYEEVLTDFYTRYPEDKTIEAPEILKLLAYDTDGKLTAIDLHKRVQVIK